MKVEAELPKDYIRLLKTQFEEDYKWTPISYAIFSVLLLVLARVFGESPLVALIIILLGIPIFLREVVKYRKFIGQLSNAKRVRAIMSIHDIYDYPEVRLRKAFISAVLFSVIYFAVGILAGYYLTSPMPKQDYISMVRNAYESGGLFVAILKNNVLTGIVVVVVGFVVGLSEIAVIPMATTALNLGAVLQYSRVSELLPIYLTHGAVELPAFTLLGFSGVALKIGVKSKRRDIQLLAVALMLVGFVMIVVGAYIESHVSVAKLLSVLSS